MVIGKAWPTVNTGLVWLKVGVETVEAPVVTVTNNKPHWPPLSHTEILLLPAARPVIMALLPLICTEAAAELLLFET